MIETFEEANDREYDIWPRKASLHFFGPRELREQNDKFSNIW